jgi:hypothetical protein
MSEEPHTVVGQSINAVIFSFFEINQTLAARLSFAGCSENVCKSPNGLR